MPDLVPPALAVHRSFLAALHEFQGETRYTELDVAELAEPARFSAYIEGLLAQALPDTPRPTGWVPTTHLWFVGGANYLGRLSIRHELTDRLRALGGQIGYDIRPGARRRGHATRMLALSLPVARRLRIDPALVTCDVDNIASRRVIVHNGGCRAGRRAPVLGADAARRRSHVAAGPRAAHLRTTEWRGGRSR